MLCPAAAPHTFLCFAVSDFYDRLVEGSRERAVETTEKELRRLGGCGEVPYAFDVPARRFYSNTMVYYQGWVTRWTVDAAVIGGFVCVPMLVDEGCTRDAPSARSSSSPIEAAPVANEAQSMRFVQTISSVLIFIRYLSLSQI